MSSLIKGWWRQFADAAETGRVVLISSPAAIDEFVEVAERSAFRDLIAQPTRINSATLKLLLQFKYETS